MWSPYTVWICAVLFLCYIARYLFISSKSHEKVIVIELESNNDGSVNSFSYESISGTKEDIEMQDNPMLPLYILSFLDNMTEPHPNRCHY
ncbi:unnamed protein product [Caenorhabditis brenneri]